MSTVGVVFDFDGVLANTELLHLRAYQQVLQRRGWWMDEASYYERYLGYNDEETIRQYVADQRLPLDAGGIRALVREKTVAYQGVLDGASIFYPGAADCVRALGREFPLAIASGSLGDEIARILRAEGLTDAFAAIVSADDVRRSKPAPDPYLAAAERMGVPAARCVAIEDTNRGLASAQAAGMRTIAITTTMPVEVLASADRIVARVSEVTVELVRALAAPGA